MRIIHFEHPSAAGGVQPLCGSWGSMDTDWTPVAAGVTCVACRDAMRKLPQAVPSGNPSPSERASAH